MGRREPWHARARHPSSRPRDESGSATVLALGVIAVVLTVTIGGLAVLGALRAVHVARSSADLAALAAAGHFQQHVDPVAACAEGRRVVRRQSAQVTRCRIGAGGVASVTVSAPITGGLSLGPEAAHGQARAGPG